MSRHKLVKTMNLDDELDDFDGGENYDYDGDVGSEEQLSNEDKQQLREGTAKVRSILGSEDSITDKDIQDSLWHYYYDVEKTVNYLLNQRNPQPKKSKKKKEQPEAVKANGKLNAFFDPHQHVLFRSVGTVRDVGAGMSSLGLPPPMDSALCCARFSAAEFFKDSPWLQIPEGRRGDILIEPLYPCGGLLGGSSTVGGPKVSKLAALAAARKKKENDNPGYGTTQNATSSVALLDKLGAKTTTAKTGDESHPKPKTSSSETTPFEKPAKLQDRKYSVRNPQSSALSTQPENGVSGPKVSEDLAAVPESSVAVISVPAAAPSIFAKTIFGSLEEIRKTPNTLLDPSSFYVSSMFTSSTELDPFAGPSPDDIVIKAQNSKGTKTSKGQAQIAKNKTMNGLEKELNNVKIDDMPKPRSKNLDVIAEYETSKAKNAANFVVIGHVDAGKSTLMGRLLYDLKVVDQRTIDKYRREAESIGKSSFALAWVLDQGTEERNRGVTIDIAMNNFETDKTSFTILDAPGHRDFIPNMIAGASQADFAVLVIDASTGSFESGLKGQTKEHALLVRSIGVQRIIIAVNKLDTVQWSEDRFNEISQQISAFLTSAGFFPKNITFVPCSGLTGDNIVRPISDPLASWYKGPPLIVQLESLEPIARALEKPLRMTIGDIFRGGVQNPLSISGRLEAGSVQIGDAVLTIPARESATIRALEVDGEPSDWAVAGQNVTLHLADIEAKHLRSGDVVCSPSAPINSVSTLTIKILAFDHVVPMHIEVHRGRLHVPGRVTKLVAVLDKASGAVLGGKKKPRMVKPGEVARIVVEVEEAVPLETGGRVILRAGGETVAAGLLE